MNKSRPAPGKGGEPSGPRPECPEAPRTAVAGDGRAGPIGRQREIRRRPGQRLDRQSTCDSRLPGHRIAQPFPLPDREIGVLHRQRAKSAPGPAPRGSGSARSRSKIPEDHPSATTWCITSTTTCPSGDTRRTGPAPGAPVRPGRTAPPRPLPPRRAGRPRRSRRSPAASPAGPGPAPAGRVAGRHGEDGAQHLVPGDHVTKRRLQRRISSAPSRRAGRWRCRSPRVRRAGRGTTVAAGRTRGAPRAVAGRLAAAGPAAVACRSAASPAAVGRVEDRPHRDLGARARPGSGTPAATASSEWPPRAKKSSSGPTRSTPSTLANRPRSCLLGDRGGARLVPAGGIAGGGQGGLVQLAGRGHRQRGHDHHRRGHHVAGQPGRGMRAHRRGQRGSPSPLPGAAASPSMRPTSPSSSAGTT